MACKCNDADYFHSEMRVVVFSEKHLINDSGHLFKSKLTCDGKASLLRASHSDMLRVQN